MAVCRRRLALVLVMAPQGRRVRQAPVVVAYNHFFRALNPAIPSAYSEVFRPNYSRVP